MSTEHDPTTPVPAQPPAPTGDRPTAPLDPEAGPRADDPTTVLGTTGRDAAGTRPIPRAAPAGSDAGVTRPIPRPVGPEPDGGGERPVVTERSAPARTSVLPGAAPAASDPTPPAASDTLPPTASGTAAPAPSDRRAAGPLRVGTVVWGLVLALVGVGVIAIAGGAQVDLELAAIGLLALAGLALVIGSVVTSARRRH